MEFARKKMWLSRWKKIFVLLLVLSTSMAYLASTFIYPEVRRLLYTSIDVNDWLKSRTEACDGHFIGYGNQFAVLKNVTIVPERGEMCLPLTCRGNSLSAYSFKFGKEGTHMNQWLTAVKNCSEVSWKAEKTERHEGFAVVVRRYEYLNLYHTMTDWYNVFLVIKLLNLSFSDLTIIILDQHPQGSLDVVWEKLFKRVIYWTVSRPLYFKKMIWSVIGYESPMNYHSLQTLPFADDFSQFFLDSHSIVQSKTLDCNNISVLLSFRRDYFFAPGTPLRVLKRKIANENELMDYFKENYKTMHITGLQLDQLAFNDQLGLVANTDILIAMHGAGISHVMFLPKHAGVVELFPLYWTKYSTPHFKAFSRWRHLKYSAYQNWNSANELPDYKTYIPPASLAQHVLNVVAQMC